MHYNPITLTTSYHDPGSRKIQVEADEYDEIYIHERFALSPRLFSKAIEMINGVSSVFIPVNNVEILSICL